MPVPAPLVVPLLPSPSVALVRMSVLPPERARVLVAPAVVPTRTLLLAAMLLPWVRVKLSNSKTPAPRNSEPPFKTVVAVCVALVMYKAPPKTETLSLARKSLPTVSDVEIKVVPPVMLSAPVEVLVSPIETTGTASVPRATFTMPVPCTIWSSGIETCAPSMVKVPLECGASRPR